MLQDNNNLERSVVVISEDKELQTLIKEVYPCNQFVMECFNSVTEAMSELDTKGKLEAIREQGRIGAIITDFKNVESEGTNGIQSVMQKYPEIPVLMLASAKHYHGVVESFEKSLPTLRELEKKYIKHVLNKTGGRKEKAAKLLGLNRRTLYRKEREYGWVKGGVQS